MEYIYPIINSNVYSWIIYFLKSSIVIPRIGFKLCIRAIAQIYNTCIQILQNNSINQLLLTLYTNSPDFAAIFVSLVIASLGVFVYIKLKYPFWNIQPCFHSYDFWRYAYRSPFIIRQEPWITKYCNFDAIKTYNYLQINQELQNQVIDLLRIHYIETDRLLYTICRSIMNAYMNGNSEKSLISVYKIDDTLNLMGAMLSRPIKIHFLENIHSITTLSAYFWDTICTHRNDTSHISRKLIQTHEYNQRILTPQIKVSLFKKEIHLCTGIVPLTKYKTITYFLQSVNKLPRLPHHTHIQHITKTNIHILLDFLEGLTTNSIISGFEFLGLSDLGVLLNLITINQIYCFCLKYKRDTLGYYFFKNANIQYEELVVGSSDSDTLHFIASYNNSKSVELFILGYMHAIKAILKLKKTVRVLLFDTISHNALILPSWNKANRQMVETECAYYLYNMVLPRTLEPNKCFILL